MLRKYLSHEDAKELMKVGSNIQVWWHRSNEKRNDVTVEFIKNDKTPISLQVSVVVNRDKAFAQDEFSDLYEMDGSEVLSAMPNQFKYILWQETAPCHKGRGYISDFWRSAYGVPHTILFPSNRSHSLSTVLLGMKLGVSVRTVSMSNGKGEDAMPMMHVKSEPIRNS